MTAPGASPWSRRAQLGVAVAIAVGLALLVAGYGGAHGQRHLDDEIGALNLAVAGVLVASAAEASFLLIGRRQVSLLRQEVLGRSVARAGVVPAAASPAAGWRPALVPGAGVTVAGSTWYHRPECLLVAGKAARPGRPGEVLDPCAVCLPEKP